MSGYVVMMKLPITSCPSCGLLSHLNSFRGGMFRLNTKCDADSLLSLLSHFQCDGHTAHTLIQWHPQPSLTSAVQSSLFMHVHSRPLTLAARLHGCCTNHSCYINNGWTFSGQSSYMHLKNTNYLSSPCGSGALPVHT